MMALPERAFAFLASLEGLPSQLARLGDGETRSALTMPLMEGLLKHLGAQGHADEKTPVLFVDMVNQVDFTEAEVGPASRGGVVAAAAPLSRPRRGSR